MRLGTLVGFAVVVFAGTSLGCAVTAREAGGEGTRAEGEATRPVAEDTEEGASLPTIPFHDSVTLSGAPCIAADPCHQGVTDGFGSCTDIGRPLPDGTPCGGSAACGGGQCLESAMCWGDQGNDGGACPMGPCTVGVCSGIYTCDGWIYGCSAPTNLPDGTACGYGQACMSGACVPYSEWVSLLRRAP
jgi:hypothetical protein